MLRPAERRYRDLARLAALASALADQAWQRVPLGNLDAFSAGVLAASIMALQATAAAGGDRYVTDALQDQDLPAGLGTATVNALAFVGVAGDGRDLTTLLDLPRITAKTNIGAGMSPKAAWDLSRQQVRMMSVTAVQDAGRGANSVALVSRPAVTGWVRALAPPSCARCTILAGRFYRWSAGFQRHPRCDCMHIPTTVDAASELTVDPMKAVMAGQVTGMSQADLHAVIFDHADLGQVVNAHRGMSTAQVYGHKLKITNEGVTVRGIAGRAMKASGGSYTRTPRLMPESIYRIAGDDRDEALRLLRRFGYLL